MQSILAILGFGLVAGAFAGAAYFIGREYTQAEYRYIAKYAGGKRANAPYFCGLSPRAWDLDGVLDMLVPVLSVVIVVIVF